MDKMNNVSAVGLSFPKPVMDEYIDDEEQELLDAVAEAIDYKLKSLGVEGVWRVDQDIDKRLGSVDFWADMEEIEYPIVSDQGRRLKVVFKIDYIMDENYDTIRGTE